MVEFGGVPLGLSPLPAYRRRGARFAGIFVAMALGLSMPVWLGTTIEQGLGDGVSSHVTAAAPIATEADPVAIKSADAKPRQSSEQQRRVLMLLLMNSAGPVRPFGNLGR